ncbi:hypothetical protein [Umezawaea beigongshangensis]|uniref:hypothetical protein n=1 Tax=Umezawaea beigongshangensis TaxID=2780383 RepID=UPI0018F11CCF|nr:hypothetical protein [Umezawaea beigongshangensis]
MLTTIALTLLAMPLALYVRHLGRRHWSRRCATPRVREGLVLFHHGARDAPSGRYRLTRS